jgi:perosamine synthetase
VPSPQRIPLARPLIGAAEEEAVLAVLRSERLSLGDRLVEFERAFARRVGAPHASACSSGTAGLHLALRAIEVSEGDEVITSPFSFVASANAILYERARPVFADIDPVSLNLDPGAASALIGPRTRALLPVDIFGYPCAIAHFEELAARSDLGIVEDACEALGACYADGSAVGSRGHPTVFGFYANKQITTGEGGMVTVAEGALKERIDSERNQGRSAARDWLEHERLGFNYRLSELAAALGIAQLERLDALLASRARVAELYRAAFTGGDELERGELEGIELPCQERAGERRSWFVYVIQLPRGARREAVIRALQEQGIASKPYLPAIHLLPHYSERFGYKKGMFPVCEQVAERSLALPFYPQMGEGEVVRVVAALRAALRAVER